MGIDFEKADRVARRIEREFANLVPVEWHEDYVNLTRIILEDEFKDSPAKAKPVSPHIFVRDVKPGEVKTEAGIYVVPSKRQGDTQKAVVLSVPDSIVEVRGKKYVERPPVVQKGQVVLYDKCYGLDIEIEGESFIMIEEKHILCVLDE